MVNIRTFVMCVASLVCGMTHVAHAESPVGAEIELQSKILDLGRLQQSASKSHVVVEYANVGDVPLVITEVRTSCSCTTASYTRGKVLPGESGEIGFTIDPSKAPKGSFMRVVQIFSTARSGVAYITIKAEIE